ncbi:MAG TPA: IPT/TIG domain-containing protein, partial [Candidatus Saccharimonadales bacterium]
MVPSTVIGGTGGIQVDVSNNGQDYSNDTLIFTYVNTTHIYSVYPDFTFIEGGTNVTLTGIGFSYIPFYFTNVSVIFGSAIVYPIFMNDTYMVVEAPSSSAAGPLQSIEGRNGVNLDVSGNGVEMTDDGWYFFYESDLSEFTLVPSSGPMSGSTHITITGSGFDNTSSELTCRFIDFLDSPPTIWYVSPISASLTQLICLSPAHTYRSGQVQLTVSNNGQDYGFSAASSFTYYPDSSESSLFPLFGSWAVPTTVNITGTNFLNTTLLYCRLTAISGLLVSSAQWVGGGGVIYVPATYLSNSSALCILPLASDPTKGTGTVQVDISNNQQDYTDETSVIFTYITPAHVISLSPAYTFDQGGSNVTVRGSGFLYSPFFPPVYCRFGTSGAAGSIVSASVLNDTLAYCVSPSESVVGGSSPVTVEVSGNGGVEYTSDGIDYYYFLDLDFSILPVSGPMTGSTAINITGTGFMPGITMSCLFTVDSGAFVYSTAPIYSSSVLLTCLSPPFLYYPARAVLQVTNNGQDYGNEYAFFDYYMNPHVYSVSPYFGSWNVSTTITISGVNFINTTVLMCRFSLSYSDLSPALPSPAL